MTSAPRKLNFADEDALLAELAGLRRGYRQHGKWILAQMAWHLGRPLFLLDAPPPPADQQRTPDQEARKRGFVDHILSTGTPPPHTKEAPPGFIPPSDASDSDIDKFEADLRKLKSHPHSRIVMGPIGPVTVDEFRRCNLFHAAHHLAFLTPTSPARREGLAFADEDAIVADIRSLQRRGYTRAGTWSLPQVCWHLDATTKARMLPGPFPPNTPEQDARRPVKEQVIATGRLPAGLPAPEQFLPPATCGDEAIDACVATIEKFKAFGGPVSPHRLFGNLTLDEGRRINRAHCAHHLSFLIPTS